MSEFQKVANVADVPNPGKITLEIDERIVVLVHVGDQFFCIDDVCTHDGGTLGDGPLEGYQLCCPRHGARFDIQTGRALTMPATVPTVVHNVKIENDEIWVQLQD